MHARAPASQAPLKFAFDRVKEQGGTAAFIELLKENYREEERLKVLDYNLLGFLKDRPAANPRIPGWELKRVEDFLRKHKTAFSKVQKKFPVPKEIIASLLWVETKYGRDLGTFHVASSYLSIAQADYPPILFQVVDVAKQRHPDMDSASEAKIQERAKNKAQWAVKELIALQEIHEKKYKDAAKLEGSFSGAFGMAQFLPSSYLQWAKGHKSQPNLFRADDSIFSVSNYLTINGWKKDDPNAQRAALFHYNRDREYGERILRMADCLKSGKKRKKWSAKRGAC